MTDPAVVSGAARQRIEDAIYHHAGMLTHGTPGIREGAMDTIVAIIAPLLAVPETTARIAELEQLAAEILASFSRTEGGHRARVGQVQIQKWHARLNPAQPWNPGGHPDWRPAP